MRAATLTRRGVIASEDSQVSAWVALMASLSPAMWLRLGEPSGSFADSSGNGRTGSAVTTGHLTRGVTGLIAGDPDAAVANDGTAANYVSTSYAPTWTNDWTALVWGKGTALGGQQLVAISALAGSGTSRNFVAANTTTGFARLFATVSTTPIGDGLKHMLTVTYVAASNTATLYVDGVSVLSVAALSPMPTGAIIFGAQGASGNGNAWNGTYDEAAFWASVLTPTQIANLYAAGA